MTICPNGGDRRSNGQFEPTDGQRAHGRRLILRACAHDEGQKKGLWFLGGAWTAKWTAFDVRAQCSFSVR